MAMSIRTASSPDTAASRMVRSSVTVSTLTCVSSSTPGSPKITNLVEQDVGGGVERDHPDVDTGSVDVKTVLLGCAQRALSVEQFLKPETLAKARELLGQHS